jgi:hypothetical protein
VSAESPLEARLADLQRTVEVGFATVKGEMMVFSERDRTSAQAERDQRDAMSRLTGRVDGLDRKVAKAVGVAIGVSGVLSAAEGFIVWALTAHH